MNPANKLARNRIRHRWPRNIISRQRLALTDYEYVVAMRKEGFDHIDLWILQKDAQKVLSEVNP